MLRHLVEYQLGGINDLGCRGGRPQNAIIRLKMLTEFQLSSFKTAVDIPELGFCSWKSRKLYSLLYPDPWDVGRSYAWARLPWTLQVWSLARYHRDFEAVIEYSWQISTTLTSRISLSVSLRKLLQACSRSFRSRLRSNKVKAHPWAHFREKQKLQ